MEGFKETSLTSAQPFPVDAFLMRNHAASFVYAAHHHDYIELLYVLEGGISLQTSDTPLHAGSGDLVVFRSGTLHAVTGIDGPHSQILVVQFLPDLLSGTSGLDPAQQHLQSFLHPMLTQPVLHRNLHKQRADWHEMVMALHDEFISRRPGYELSVRSGLYRMIVFLLREGLLEAGFGSASAFARAYRRVRGQAPGSLRRYEIR